MNKLNYINNYVAHATKVFSKVSKEEYEDEMYPIRVKLKVIRDGALFFKQEFKTIEDVFNNVVEACANTEMSMEDAHYEIAKYLLAFNECESMGWNNITDLSYE